MDPQTPTQWQEAADAASFMLHLDAARRYGLLTGGPALNKCRALELLRRAAAKGIRPARVEDLVRRFMR